MTETTMKRDWLNVGAAFTEEGDDRQEVEQQFAELEWQSLPRGGTLSVGMAPGLGIKECIKQLRLPKVTAIATNGWIERPDPSSPDPEEPMTATYAIYGIEANYKNGRARIYVLDSGTEMLPLAADFWENA